MATKENTPVEKPETKAEEPIIHKATDVAGSKVLTAIANIMAEIGTVKKAGYNEFHKYNYASAADVAHALQKVAAKHGLVIFQNQKTIEYLFDGSIINITYVFTLAHVSGEVLVTNMPLEYTGSATAKNSKGGIDDKAINKCFTAAGKYFLIGLFKIPTGDYDDADANEDTASGAGAPAPRGKKAPPVAEPEKPIQEAAAPLDPATGAVTPHAIPVPNTNGVGDPTAWASLFIAALKVAKDIAEVEEWVKINAKLVGTLPKYAPKAHKEILDLLEQLRKAPAETAPANEA